MIARLLVAIMEEKTLLASDNVKRLSTTPAEFTREKQMTDEFKRKFVYLMQLRTYLNISCLFLLILAGILFNIVDYPGFVGKFKPFKTFHTFPAKTIWRYSSCV